MSANSTDRSRLSDVQAAIVTGSSSGIGRAIALQFAEEGVKLVVCADLQACPKKADTAIWETHPEEQSLATHELIISRYGAERATFIRCDVSVERASLAAGEKDRRDYDPPEDTQILGMAEVVEETMRLTGRLDVSVNGTGPFLGSKHAVAQFLRQEPDTYGFRGTIINISSIGGQVGLMRCSAYCASKASIIGLSREVAIEYGRNGIRCNVICPGYIDTPMLQPWVAASPEFAAYLDAGIALGHLGNPADVAGAAAWLASGRESGYITGAVIPVDGGFTAR
ncbi:MAG: hypothetical protein Q9198_001726 [Flavoplaca austrocitrina]